MACKCSDISVTTLNRVIIIQTPTRTSDEFGGGTVTWATFSTVWSHINPKNAREDFHSKHLEHRVTHEITIRYLSGVLSNMRISYGSRIFQIKGIMNVEEKNQFLILKCEEGVPA